jgi:8-oxo-dGTP pyrophosphatase MutT (NUDIX family)
LGIGIVTLARILKRNRVTDEYKEALDSIRALYMERLDKEEGILHGYEPLKKSKPAARRKFGGLANLVEMLNSIVVAGIAASVVLGTRAFTGHRLDDFAAKLAGAAALFFMIAAFIAQYLLTDRLTHAGGVVYKIEEGPKFLIVKSSKDPSQWVLPKGHIRHGTMESARRAAIREVKEETGCTAKIVRKIGVSEYRFENENLRIMFFLMRLDEGKPRIKAEERDIKWLGREEAVATLQFEDSKKLVTAAAEYIESQGIGNRASR